MAIYSYQDEEIYRYQYDTKKKAEEDRQYRLFLEESMIKAEEEKKQRESLMAKLEQDGIIPLELDYDKKILICNNVTAEKNMMNNYLNSLYNIESQHESMNQDLDYVGLCPMLNKEKIYDPREDYIKIEKFQKEIVKKYDELKKIMYEFTYTREGEFHTIVSITRARELYKEVTQMQLDLKDKIADCRRKIKEELNNVAAGPDKQTTNKINYN